MENLDEIISYYGRRVQQEEERLARHRLEWDLTWRHLERYLPPQGAILEVGAATGRYTRELARRGYRVTAVDLSLEETQYAQAQLRALGLAERVEHLVADARDLSALRGRVYDAALVMGPLYHVREEEGRRRVLREVRALLRPGGLLGTAWISRFGILGILMRQAPHWAGLSGEVDAVLERGRDADQAPPDSFLGYYARSEEIAPLHEAEGFETLTLAAVEPATGGDDEPYNRLEEPLRRAWLDVLFRVSAEPSIVGASAHVLYVGRRRG